MITAASAKAADNVTPIFIVSHGSRPLYGESFKGFKDSDKGEETRFRPWICEAYAFDPVFTKKGKIDIRKTGRITHDPNGGSRIMWSFKSENVYMTREAAEIALAPLAKAYEKEHAKLVALQRECEEITAPLIAEILTVIARLPATREPRVKEEDGLVKFRLYSKECDLLRLAGRPWGEYHLLRRPPCKEAKRTFVARETKYLKEALEEITEIVDFLTSPEITKMFPEIHK